MNCDIQLLDKMYAEYDRILEKVALYQMYLGDEENSEEIETMPKLP